MITGTARRKIHPARQFRQVYEVITGLIHEDRGDITVAELWGEIEPLRLNRYLLQTPLMLGETLAVEKILIKLTGTGELP